MSDRQNLAEHGTGLCLWAIGAAASTNPLVGVAVVGMACLDIYIKSRSGRTRAAMAKAQKALADSGIPERGITAALNLIRGMKVKITVDRASLMDAQNRREFPRRAV